VDAATLEAMMSAILVTKSTSSRVVARLACARQLSSLPAAAQLGAAVVKQHVLAALEHAHVAGSTARDACSQLLFALCRLAGAGQLSGDALAQLLQAAAGWDLENLSCCTQLWQLLAAKQISSAQVLTLPAVPLIEAKQLVSAGLRLSYAQLLAAANNMVAGVEVWVQAQQQLGIQTDIPAAAVAICCGGDWVSRRGSGIACGTSCAARVLPLALHLATFCMFPKAWKLFRSRSLS
jgi:hypothetical protein